MKFGSQTQTYTAEARKELGSDFPDAFLTMTVVAGAAKSNESQQKADNQATGMARQAAVILLRSRLARGDETNIHRRQDHQSESNTSDTTPTKKRRKSRSKRR